MSGDDILALYSEVGIDNPPLQPGSVLNVYPNPQVNEGFAEFYSETGGRVNVSLTCVSGKELLKTELDLLPGISTIRTRGIPSGIYLLTVKTPETELNGRIVSIGSGNGKLSIDRAGTAREASDRYGTKAGKQYIYMYYLPGDQLLLLGHSGDYTKVYPLVPTSNYTVYFNFVPCIDPEGHPYATVDIGSQIWMAQNLNTGVRITASIDQSDNGVREKYCMGDDETFCSIYGGLYQWNEMMQYDTAEGGHGLCPEGWHLPTDGDYSALMTFLGGDSIAGGKMKETGIAHWAYPNGYATNSSGFTALPGGIRFVAGIFSGLNWFAYFWSSTQQTNLAAAWYRDIPSGWGYVYRDGYNKNWGLSVRCIKD